jgi:hypothetical protein
LLGTDNPKEEIVVTVILPDDVVGPKDETRTSEENECSRKGRETNHGDGDV